MSEQPIAQQTLIAFSRSRLASLLPVFVLATLLSSSLLFFVQPLMAKLTLPLLGGSPSVWAVTMCFFQAMLLAGYAYAHALIRFLPIRTGIIVHVVLLAVAAVVLTFDVASAAASLELFGDSTKLVLVLATTIGLPFAIMSANAPLIQSWFSQSGHAQANEPYFLYGASNLGSIASLLLYPTLVEPLVGLATQTDLWSAGFKMLVFAIAGSGMLTALGNIQQSAQRVTPTQSIPWSRCLLWLVMAFVPSAMLMAWTNHITTDVAAAPFLWLPPLVLYLLSFIAVFRERPWVSEKTLRLIQIIATPLVLVLMKGSTSYVMAAVFFCGAAAFFATTFLCHRQMYETRPEASQLTTFYLIMSLGGVLGGLFVSLAAPQLFSDVSEYPLLLILSLFLAKDVFADQSVFAGSKKWLLMTLVFFGVSIITHGAGVLFENAAWQGINAIFVAIFATAIVFFVLAKNKLLMGLFIGLLIVQLGTEQQSVLFRARNFFGVVSVVAADSFVVMNHGTTVHGAELMKDVGASNTGKPQKLTYYTEKGGIGRAILASQRHLAASGTNGNFGVVGLGAGLLSCYAQPGESWRFFEINPDVVHAARDIGIFNFMKNCGPDMPVVIGDARLKLKDEKPHSYDTLVIDAFSSDSVPVHLMTVEAMRLYLSLLTDDGLAVFHISNRHLELKSVLAANLEALRAQGLSVQGRSIIHNSHVSDLTDTASAVVVIAKQDGALKLLDGNAETSLLAPTPGVDAWTDDYANILGAIWRGFTTSYN
jgi:hypothetical protein